MVHVKLAGGCTIVLCYLLLSFVFDHFSKPSTVIVAREEMVVHTPCVNCIAILGGSNAVYSVRSKFYDAEVGRNSTDRTLLNLSLWNEGFGFENYITWLSHLHLHPSIVVYSSASIYNLNTSFIAKDSTQGLNGRSIFPAVSTDRLITSLARTDPAPVIDEYGDLTNYNCKSAIQPLDFRPLDPRAAERFARNVASIAALYKGATVFIRTPPVYVSQRQYRDWVDYFSTLRRHFDQYKLTDAVLNFRPQFTTDKQKFCDFAFHVSELFATQLTRDLVQDIETRAPQLAND